MTYEEVATHFEVRLCSSNPGCAYRPVDHQRGVAGSRDTIHWAPRRMNVRGLRIFLTLVAQVRILRYWNLSKPMRIYASATWAQRAASQLHVRFPRRYSQADRTRVLWLISQGHEATPAALRWAARKEDSE
jgi:hypothetical protein